MHRFGGEAMVERIGRIHQLAWLAGKPSHDPNKKGAVH
jgi:hypothetical protein